MLLTKSTLVNFRQSNNINGFCFSETDAIGFALSFRSYFSNNYQANQWSFKLIYIQSYIIRQEWPWSPIPSIFLSPWSLQVATYTIFSTTLWTRLFMEHDFLISSILFVEVGNKEDSLRHSDFSQPMELKQLERWSQGHLIHQQLITWKKF